MPQSLPDTFIQEKNKQQNAPIYLYTIYAYDGSNNLYFAQHDEAVPFNGQTYTSFPITHERISENTTGEIDVVSVRVSNVNRVIQSYLEDYDWRGLKVIITTVFKDQLSDPDYKRDDIYSISEYTADADVAEFTLTTKFSLMQRTLPSRLYMRNHCGSKFKSSECGYVGSDTECDRNLQTCKLKANQLRVGSFPSVPTKRVYT